MDIKASGVWIGQNMAGADRMLQAHNAVAPAVETMANISQPAILPVDIYIRYR